MNSVNLSPLDQTLTVILPTLNEEGNIYALISEVLEQCEGLLKTRVLVVDDSSEDNTASEALRAKQNGMPVDLIQNNPRLGLGASIGLGLSSVTTDYVAVMDSDFTHSPSELVKMIWVSVACGFVSGSRYSAGGAMESRLHYIASYSYQIFLRLVIGTRLRDLLGGFWVSPSRLVVGLRDLDLIFQGYGDYFFRLLTSLGSRGHGIIELPTFYSRRRVGKSKSNFSRMALNYIILAARWRFHLSRQSGRKLTPKPSQTAGALN